MKKINIITVLILANIALSINAETKVIIENFYNKAIVINVDGKKSDPIPPYGRWLLPSWPNKEISINVLNNIVYHKGIQDEIAKVKKAAETNPNLTAIITVSEKDAFHFAYNTETSTPRAEFPNVPLIINNNLSISRQGQTAEQVLTDPKSTLNHDSATAQLIDAIEKGYYGTAIEQVIRQFKNTSYRGTSARSSESNNPYNQFLNIIPNTLRSGVPSITQLRNEIKMSVDSILNKMQQYPSKYYTN
jgi:hypothetical protein